MQRSRIIIAGIALSLSSCATTEPQTIAPTEVAPQPTPIVMPAPAPVSAPAPAPRTCEMFVRPGVLKRSALVRLIDAGLPRWLQGVEGDRALAHHKFQGWLIKSLHAGDPCYEDVDLQPGDIVQKVNGQSIEKPEQAFDIAQSLRTAPELSVEYLRAGKPRQFTLAVSGE